MNRPALSLEFRFLFQEGQPSRMKIFAGKRREDLFRIRDPEVANNPPPLERVSVPV